MLHLKHSAQAYEALCSTFVYLRSTSAMGDKARLDFHLIARCSLFEPRNTFFMTRHVTDSGKGITERQNRNSILQNAPEVCSSGGRCKWIQRNRNEATQTASAFREDFLPAVRTDHQIQPELQETAQAIKLSHNAGSNQTQGHYHSKNINKFTLYRKYEPLRNFSDHRMLLSWNRLWKRHRKRKKNIENEKYGGWREVELTWNEGSKFQPAYRRSVVNAPGMKRCIWRSSSGRLDRMFHLQVVFKLWRHGHSQVRLLLTRQPTAVTSAYTSCGVS
jgi:hypothetical protein